jgi:hypothetical protein
MDHAAVEAALNGDRIAFGDGLGTFTARAGIDQCAAAIVLHDELVAEDFRDLSLYRDRCVVLEGANRAGLQQHHGLRIHALDPA